MGPSTSTNTSPSTNTSTSTSTNTSPSELGIGEHGHVMGFQVSQRVCSGRHPCVRSCHSARRLCFCVRWRLRRIHVRVTALITHTRGVQGSISPPETRHQHLSHHRPPVGIVQQGTKQCNHVGGERHSPVPGIRHVRRGGRSAVEQRLGGVFHVLRADR